MTKEGGQEKRKIDEKITKEKEGINREKSIKLMIKVKAKEGRRETRK